ncbi:unnamed protein product, partial [Hapterophycus canaliculatus]
DDRRRRASQDLRRRSSMASDLTQSESDRRHSGLPRRRSLPVSHATQDDDPCRALSPREDDNDHLMRTTHGDGRRATEVWRVQNSPGDGWRSASRADRRWSTGSGGSRCIQRGPRRSLAFYSVAENDGEESRGLPPDDQSVDYQNGGIVYRDEHCDEHDRAAYGDDDQNLNYYYQEGGYYAYAEDEYQEGYDRFGVVGNDGSFAGQGNPEGERMGSTNKHEQMPTDTEGYPDHSRWPSSGVAHDDDKAAGDTTFAPQSGGYSVEPQTESVTREPIDQQRISEAATGAPAGVVVVPTGPLPAAPEETRSFDDPDPPHRSHGRMGRRGSPFNLIFNMCDGMLTDLKGLGTGDRMGSIDDGTHEFQPSRPDGQADTRDEDTFDAPTAADLGGERNQEEKDAFCRGGAKPAFQTSRQKAPENDVDGRGTGEPPPPILRGATYASLTRKIVAVSNEGWPKAKKDPSSGDGSDTARSNRALAGSFSAWAERTEGRLRHRDAKAEKHFRVGRLRHAMSAWEAHQATFLGSRMAEAFAGSFGLSSRFFVRFTFDALRAHAKGARVAARNRAVIGTFVSRMERFGMAKLRQAWRRWVLPILGPGYWGVEDAEKLDKLCRYWSKGHLLAAVEVWRRRQPRQRESGSEPVRSPLHAAGSFATLKGKLKAAGSFATLKKVPPTSATSKPTATVSKGSRRQEDSFTATNANGKDEDSWAEWLGNDAEEGEMKRPPVDPSAKEPLSVGGDSNTTARGPSVLSPSRSFRGLGVALKSMKSFRDGRDKSQTQRPRLRPTASFGSPPSPSSSSPAPPPPIPVDPSTAASAMQGIDGYQVQHFASNRTKLRAEAARLKSREDAATTIQRALWRTPREKQVAVRVSRSAFLIQELWRLRSRRRRAGFRLVRAWRARFRARITTLNRALLEAAEEGDLRAVAFLLRPSTATMAV